jgi:hypothetical protein
MTEMKIFVNLTIDDDVVIDLWSHISCFKSKFKLWSNQDLHSGIEKYCPEQN